MNRKISLGAAVTFAVLLMVATFCLTMIFSNQMFNNRLANVKQREQMYEKLAEIDAIVRQKYDGEITDATLYDGLANGYMSGLGDSYATYLTKEEYEVYLQENQGEAADVGLTLYAEASGYLLVGEVLDSSPAADAGIVAGDLIIQVDGQNCTAENADKMIIAMDGAAGTTVTITYRRDAEDKSVELVRKQLNRKTVVSKVLSNQVGMLRFLSFNDKTATQFQDALHNLSESGCKSYVLDLRDVATDQIESVCKVLSTLVPEGPLAMAQHHDGTNEVLYKSTSNGYTGSFVVLVNEKTSQGGELFAAVMRDYGLAKLVGTKTAGKGVIQELVSLSDGSALLITTAKLASPKSDTFDAVGLTPNFLQTASAENPNAATTMNPDEDIQLKKALDLLATGSSNSNTESSESSDVSESHSVETSESSAASQAESSSSAAKS